MIDKNQREGDSRMEDWFSQNSMKRFILNFSGSAV